MDEKLIEAIKKRAYGYDYFEEVIEEDSDNFVWVECNQKKRLYHKNGFLKVTTANFLNKKRGLKSIRFCAPLVVLGVEKLGKKLIFKKIIDTKI